MAVVWLACMIAGFAVAVMASGRSVRSAEELSHGLGLSPFWIGAVLMAIGTDLPEMANSIVASFAGHGDVNAGDSIGSAATQVTLVLGLVPFLAGSFDIDGARVARIGAFTVAGLGLGAVLFSDGTISRWDAVLLIGLWAVATAHEWRNRAAEDQQELPLVPPNRARNAALVLGYLILVAAGSSVGVYALIELASLLELPEYLLSFFLASVGTSLPELMVDVAAVRRGQAGLAVGDAFGSSFIDVTLSVSVGPLLVPNIVTPELVLRGTLGALVIIAAVSALLYWRGHHDHWTGVALLAGYAAFYPVLLL